MNPGVKGVDVERPQRYWLPKGLIDPCPREYKHTSPSQCKYELT